MYRSDPSRLHFSRRSLSDCTAFSASPLLCVYLGVLVVCLNHQVSEKFLNSVLAYCGPLSEYSLSGILNLAKWLLSFSITTLDVVLVIEFNSYQPEYESAVAVLFHVKRSEVTMDQGLLGTWCDLRGSFYWCGFILLHTGHSATSFSMSLFMAGQ